MDSDTNGAALAEVESDSTRWTGVAGLASPDWHHRTGIAGLASPDWHHRIGIAGLELARKSNPVPSEYRFIDNKFRAFTSVSHPPPSPPA